MPARRLLPLLIVLLLILPGCFRQAGEAFDPSTDSGAQNSDGVVPSATPVESNTSEGAETPAPTDENALPPVTIISPPSATPTEEAPDTQSIDQPQETTVPDTQPTVGGGVELLEPTATAQVFLTPGSGLPITDIPPTQLNVTPTSTPSGLVTPTALSLEEGDGCTYTVQPGNTLFSIARNNGIDLDQLREANPELVGDLIQPGQVLIIPGCGAGVDEQGNPVQPTSAAPSTNDSGQTIHVVQAGDTLVRIARQYDVTVQAIVTANNLANPNLLAVGQELIIPTPEP
ncbi:MAG: LysM peptidoglycan-binding domain-containing protein [Anaerolineae bacterium]